MGEGEFGPVVRAIARNIVPGEESTPVAVKVLMPHEGEESFQPDLILSDFVNQMKLSSPYIATILGLCTDQEPYHVIYQYLDKVRGGVREEGGEREKERERERERKGGKERGREGKREKM